MKTDLSSGLTDHIAEQVTSLATLWRVTRADGKQLGFTDHDRDLAPPWDTLVYEAATGYRRTAMQHHSDFAVSDLELEGLLKQLEELDGNLLNSDRITDADLRNGKYNDAVVEIFLVNWRDLSQGPLKYLKGNVGKVKLQNRTYQAEMRGLMHKFQKQMGEKYSARCRADLFDARCKLDPDDFREANRVASVTSRRVFTLEGTVAAGAAEAVTLTNPGAEDGDETGWSTDVAEDTEGGLTASGSLGSIDPRTGSFLWSAQGTGTLVAALRQAFDPVVGAVTTSAIDAGRLSVVLSVWYQHASSDGRAVLGLRFRDDKGAEILTAFSEPFAENQGSYAEAVFSRTIPLATREVEVILRLEKDSIAGGFDVAYDDVSVSVQDLGETALVETGDFYNGGLVTWLSGPNQGLSMEVKTLDTGTGEVGLFLPMAFPVVVGSRFEILPGCDKRLATCRDKFDNVVNMRAEPHIPGNDHLMRYPDAQ